MENAPISSGDSEDVLGFQELANLSDAEKIDKEKTREEKMAEAFSRCQSAYEEILKEAGSEEAALGAIDQRMKEMWNKAQSLGVNPDDYKPSEDEMGCYDAVYYYIVYVQKDTLLPEPRSAFDGRYEVLPDPEMENCTISERAATDEILGQIGFFIDTGSLGEENANDLKQAVLNAVMQSQYTDGEGRVSPIPYEEGFDILEKLTETDGHMSSIISRAAERTIENFDAIMSEQQMRRSYEQLSPYGPEKLKFIASRIGDESKKELQEKLDNWAGRISSIDRGVVDYGLERIGGASPLSLEGTEPMPLENMEKFLFSVDQHANNAEVGGYIREMAGRDKLEVISKNQDAVRWVIGHATSISLMEALSEKSIAESIEGAEGVADMLKASNSWKTRQGILSLVDKAKQTSDNLSGQDIRTSVFDNLVMEITGANWPDGDDIGVGHDELLPLLLMSPDLLQARMENDESFAHSVKGAADTFVEIAGKFGVSAEGLSIYRHLTESQIRESPFDPAIKSILIRHKKIENPKIALMYARGAIAGSGDEVFFDDDGFNMDAILHAGRIDILLGMPDDAKSGDILNYEDIKGYIDDEKVPEGVRKVITEAMGIEAFRRKALTALLTCPTSEDDDTPIIDSRFMNGELEGLDSVLGKSSKMLIRAVSEDFRFTNKNLDEVRQMIIEGGFREMFDENGPNDGYFIYRFGKNGSRGVIGGQDIMLNDNARRLLQGTVDDENILLALSSFMHNDADDWSYASEADLKIKEAFQSTETKDMALAKIRELYEAALKDPEHIPNELAQLYRSMNANEGAGPLTQIESNLSFIGELITNRNKDSLELAKLIEERFSSEKWSESDKSEFYDISGEIMHADPELFNEFAVLFTGNELSRKDFSTFVKEIYPLYRAKLVLLSRRKDESDGIGSGANYADYSHLDKEELRNQLHLMLLPFNLQSSESSSAEKALAIVKEKVFEDIASTFRERFGISEEVIPESFSKEDGKAIEDMVLYLGNIHESDEKKEALIGYYLALHLGNKGEKWKEFRADPSSISPTDYLDASKARLIQDAIRASRENCPIKKIGEMGVAKEKVGAFSMELQVETSAIRTGNIQTVDQRLQSLIGNIEELKDPDLYPDLLDKAKIAVLQKYSENPKIIGSTVAKLWQQSAGKNIELTEEESAVANDLLSMLADNGVEVTTESIGAHLQKGLKTIGLPFSLARTIEDTGAKGAIADLQAAIHPTSELISIFDKIGEEFKPHSGAIALTTDIGFLRSQIRKNEDKLTEEEKREAEAYLEEIDAKLVVVQEIYDRAIRSFDQMEKQSRSATPGVTAKIAEISRIVHGRDRETTITSTCTSDMMTIIENMRACLSAKTNGCNNDTDLTFGEPYKFYVYSKEADSSKGSVSDEIVHFLPAAESEESAPDRMCFVMDQVYGAKNKDIIVGHIGVMFKKARELKEKFPEAPISILVTGASMTSCGVDLDEEQLRAELEGGEYDLSNISIRRTEAVVDEPESGYGDHYIEYSNLGPRQAGKRSVSGLEIVF